MAKHRSTEQQLAAAEERLNRLRERQRKEDTRRKILVGAMILAQAEANDELMDQLHNELDEWLQTGHRDRKLFGLGPLSGLRNATLGKVENRPGWSLGVALEAPRQACRDMRRG